MHAAFPDALLFAGALAGGFVSGLASPALAALPGTSLGAWIGTRAYHAMNDRNFSDVVLGLLALSGLGLLWSSIRAFA